MRLESLMFVASVVISTYIFGIGSTPALFIFGAVWLVMSNG